MKRLTVVLIFGFSSFLYSHSTTAWEVAEVRIEGVRNIKEKLILKTIKAKKGKIYYDEDKKADIENILNLGGVERVSVEIEPVSGKISEKNIDLVSSTTPVRVIYRLYEKPYIEMVSIKGNKKLSVSTIKSEISLDKGDFYDELKLREGILKVLDKYKEKGYIFATIDWDVSIDTTTLKAFINIEVSEGEQVRVRSVSIKGIEDEKQIKKTIKLMKNRPKKVFIEANIARDLKEIDNYYKNNGFMDFTILSSTYTISQGRFADIEIEISRGRKYRFGSTNFSGIYLLKDEMKKIESLVEYNYGEVFKDEKIKDTIRNIQELYAEKGYLKVEITTTTKTHPESDYVDVSYDIEENYPFYVRDIYIEGNKSTKTKTLKREIIQRDKQYCQKHGLDRSCYLFNLTKVRRSQEKIFNLGFIENIDMMINPTDIPDEVDLVFDISEGKPGMFTAGGGVSSKEGVMGMISLSHLNMFGLANRVSLNWNFGRRIQDYSFNWTIPWIYEKPTSLGISLFNNRRYRSYSTTYSAYTERRTGGSLSLSPRFEDDKYSLRFAYSYERIRVYDVAEIYQSEISQGTSVQSSISIEFSRDTRDYIWDPTSGARLRVGVELFGGVLGGDIDIYKPSVSYSYNKKLFSIGGWPFVFSVANRFGWVKEFSNTQEVPVYERFFLGGADTIRGYNSNGQVGPRSGGKVYYITNAEFKFPLAREKKRTVVQGAFFVDVGNSWSSFSDISLKIGSHERYLKVGAGFGIRFTTPAFPVRLDWGYGFNHKPGEQRSDIYFTIGNLF